MFNDSSPAEIETIMQNAWNAFHIYRKLSLQQRANFMRAIATALESGKFYEGHCYST
ncbi:MAG: hypothetical protein NTX08_04670 [Sphingobacteriales bacterium]|nr:hypothetical protein [Sphingobacteriales bacterium]